MMETELIIAYLLLIVGIFQLFQQIKWAKKTSEDRKLWKEVNKYLNENRQEILNEMIRKKYPERHNEIKDENR